MFSMPCSGRCAAHTSHLHGADGVGDDGPLARGDVKGNVHAAAGEQDNSRHGTCRLVESGNTLACGDVEGDVHAIAGRQGSNRKRIRVSCACKAMARRAVTSKGGCYRCRRARERPRQAHSSRTEPAAPQRDSRQEGEDVGEEDHAVGLERTPRLQADLHRHVHILCRECKHQKSWPKGGAVQK